MAKRRRSTAFRSKWRETTTTINMLLGVLEPSSARHNV
jgi:hypothetical protein